MHYLVSMSLARRFTILAIIVVISHATAFSCTIFCAKDKHGHVWAANNEDFYWFDFSTQLGIVPGKGTALSFLYFKYHNLHLAQGGINEAGLFYDANMVETSPLKGGDKKPAYPGTTSEFVFYMLGHCRTVPEALALFEKYKIPELAAAQIHLADKSGNMGFVTADSAWLTTKDFQVSTNYNLCHKDDDYKNCWRYPIAYSMLSRSEPNLNLMTSICDSTHQHQYASTIYSNVHDLTTGEMWLYYAWNYKNPYKATISDLLALGDTTIMIRDLFKNEIAVEAYNAFHEKDFKAAMSIINTIKDPVLREEKLTLFSQGLLFSFDEFIKTEKVVISNDDHLVRQVIEATNDIALLTTIRNQKISRENKELAESKLKKVQKSSTNGLIILGLIVVGGTVCFLFVRRKIKRQATSLVEGTNLN